MIVFSNHNFPIAGKAGILSYNKEVLIHKPAELYIDDEEQLVKYVFKVKRN
jgi:hypothetical protein